MAVKKEFTYRKYMGDDRYSWAVFKRGQIRPVDSGLSRSSAKYEADRFNRLHKEKSDV